MNWPDPPPPTADWDAIVRYADGVDGYKRAGSFQGCMAVAAAVTDAYNRTKELPRDGGALALTVFVEVRRYRLVGSPDGQCLTYLRTLLAALSEFARKAS